MAKLRNPDGSYGKGDAVARDTGSAVVIVLRLGGKVENRDNVLRVSRPASAATAVSAKRGPGIRTWKPPTASCVPSSCSRKSRPTSGPATFVARCRDADGYGVSPGQPPNVSGTYFASTILHWLAEP